jgi:hypothetical protein
MGTLRGDNGGGRPPDGDGLPDLPPEWGTIIIPDDPAELAHEAGRVRRELRRRARRSRWHRRLRLPPSNRSSGEEQSPALGLPLLIMAIAIVATMTSLFAFSWPAKPGQLTTPASAAASAATPASVPDLTLSDASGAPFRLRNRLPAAVLLVDGCDCAQLIADTAAAAPAKVTVIAVGHTAPALVPAVPGGRLVAAADEGGGLRSTYASAPPAAGVVVILIKGTGQVARTVATVTKVDDFRPTLVSLA